MEIVVSVENLFRDEAYRPYTYFLNIPSELSCAIYKQAQGGWEKKKTKHDIINMCGLAYDGTLHMSGLDPYQSKSELMWIHLGCIRMVVCKAYCIKSRSTHIGLI